MALPKTKRSGGPQSPEGKAASSGNALKTGAYSLQVLLPGESQSDFEDLLDQFRQDFAPQDVAEAAMVRDLAAQVWKQLRVEKMQHSMLLADLGRVVSEDDLNYIARFYFPSERYQFLTMVFEDDFAQRVRTEKNMVRIFEDFTTPPTKAFLAAFKKEAPDEYSKFKQLFGLEHEDKGEFEDAVLMLEVPANDDDDANMVNFLQQLYDADRQYRERIFWLDDNKTKIIQAYQTVKADRAMKFMQNVNIARVTDDVQRAFYRTLAELRKHQTWRRSQIVVDISPATNITAVPGGAVG